MTLPSMRAVQWGGEGTPLGRLKLLDRLIDRPNVFQICLSVDFDTPQCLAIFALDQCVAFAGVDSSVSTASYSTCSTLISAGRPGRAYQLAYPDACPGTGSLAGCLQSGMGFSDFFGIHSPSKQMAWVGDVLVAGLAGAITSRGYKAVDGAANMAKDTMDAMGELTNGVNVLIKVGEDLSLSSTDLTLAPVKQTS